MIWLLLTFLYLIFAFVGRHLVDLPLSPQLGKMILYAVVLKCLDPVVTIACALAYRDPCKDFVMFRL